MTFDKFSMNMITNTRNRLLHVLNNKDAEDLTVDFILIINESKVAVVTKAFALRYSNKTTYHLLIDRERYSYDHINFISKILPLLYPTNVIRRTYPELLL